MQEKNEILPITFISQDMTTNSGLALLDHVLRLHRLQALIKEGFKYYLFSGDYHTGDLLFVILVMLLWGAERLQRIDHLRSDFLFCRVARLTRSPYWTKISTALKQFRTNSNMWNSHFVWWYSIHLNKSQEKSAECHLNFKSAHLAFRGLLNSSFKDCRAQSLGLSEQATTAIHEGSGGLFRKANHVAREALIAAAAEKSQQVSSEHVRLASAELILEQTEDLASLFSVRGRNGKTELL